MATFGAALTRLDEGEATGRRTQKIWPSRRFMATCDRFNNQFPAGRPQHLLVHRASGPASRGEQEKFADPVFHGYPSG